MGRSACYAICLALLIGCTKPPPYQIQLPYGDIHNVTYGWKDVDPYLTLTQNSDSTVAIDWQTTETAKIDSNLHGKIYDMVGSDNLQNMWLKTRFFLDQEMPMSTFKQLLLECRKLDLRVYWCITSDSLPFGSVLPPLTNKRNAYLAPQISSVLRETVVDLPPMPSTMEVLRAPNLYLKISSQKIKVSDFHGNEIADYKTYLRENPKTITVYEFEDDCTYQDYITTLNFMYRPIYELRKEASADTNLTKKDIKKLHPFRCTDIDYIPK